MGCGSSVQVALDTGENVKPQPVTPDSRLLRGQAYYAAGRVQEALKELNSTIATWPTYARAYLERGNIRLDQKDFSMAIGDYTMALQLQGNLLQAYQMRCHARLALRQYQEALQDAKAAERLDPENAQVRALKAQVRKAIAGGAAAGAGGGGGGRPGGGGGTASVCGSEDDDAFAGADTPKSTPSPSVRKLCMVCMDSERECRLRPCMHAALCVECAEGLMARGYPCPICSCKIEQVERGTFLRTFTVEEAQGIVASARIVSSTASPGKSPLGRRFPTGTTAPSLDDIIEGDEEAHTNGDPSGRGARSNRSVGTSGSGGDDDGRRLGMQLSMSPPSPSTSGSTAAVRTAAVTGPERAVSSISGDSTGNIPPPPPPVQLDPHPLTTRSSRRTDGADAVNGLPGTGAGMVGAAGGSPPQRPPPLPGAVEEDVVSQEPARGPSRGSATGGGLAGGADRGRTAGPGRANGAGGGSADGAPPSPTGGLSPVASAVLANSLADWIDEHQSPNGGGARAAAASAAAAAANGNATAGSGARGAPTAGPDPQARRESFMGFSMPSAGAGSGAAGPQGASPVPATGPNAVSGLRRQGAGPVAESRCNAVGSLYGRVVAGAHGTAAGASRVSVESGPTAWCSVGRAQDASRLALDGVFFDEDPRLLEVASYHRHWQRQRQEEERHHQLYQLALCLGHSCSTLGGPARPLAAAQPLPSGRGGSRCVPSSSTTAWGRSSTGRSGSGGGYIPACPAACGNDASGSRPYRDSMSCGGDRCDCGDSIGIRADGGCDDGVQPGNGRPARSSGQAWGNGDRGPGRGTSCGGTVLYSDRRGDGVSGAGCGIGGGALDQRRDMDGG